MRRLSLPLTLAATAVTALAVAGCATSEQGSPTAQTGARSTSAPTTSAPTTTAVTDAPSQRPKDIDLAGIDPCATLSADQTVAWGIDSAPRSAPMGGGSALAGSPACSLDSAAQQSGVLVVTSTSFGLADYLKVGDHSDARETSIDGFPAAVEEGTTSAPERGSGECYAMVDVSDGQLLLVQFSQIAAAQDKRLPIETLCAKAEEVAEAALTTLQGG